MANETKVEAVVEPVVDVTPIDIPPYCNAETAAIQADRQKDPETPTS